MRLTSTAAATRAAIDAWRASGESVGFVPTMGALHPGHIALIEASLARCDRTVVSVFVNPAQFGEGEDFDAYPRDLDADMRLAEAAGTDLAFAPEVGEIYPDGFATTVEVEGLSEVLCGDPARRGPDHFHGVTTVVAKLLAIVDPNVLFMGRKDAQQTIVVGRMISDLGFRCELSVEPTVRDDDGLALSSRNAYLSDAERSRALAIPDALRGIAAAVEAGTSLETALADARAGLAESGIEPEYLEARDASDLSAVSVRGERPVLIAIAARVGSARLIDNVVLEPAGVTEPALSG